MKGNDYIYVYLQGGEMYATRAAHVTRCYVKYFDDNGNLVRVHRDKVITQKQWAEENGAEYSED